MMKLLLSLVLAIAAVLQATAFAPCAATSITAFTGSAVAAREVLSTQSSLRMMVRAIEQMRFMHSCFMKPLSARCHVTMRATSLFRALWLHFPIDHQCAMLPRLNFFFTVMFILLYVLYSAMASVWQS
jgi:hypothetical protein